MHGGAEAGLFFCFFSLLGGLRDGVSDGKKLVRDGCGEGGRRHGAERHALHLFLRRRRDHENELVWMEVEGEREG